MLTCAGDLGDAVRKLRSVGCKGKYCGAAGAITDSLAERSKAVAQGAIPKGRGFEPHSCHFV